MTKFIIRRAIGLIPLFFGVVVISFLLMKPPRAAPRPSSRASRSSQEQIATPGSTRWCLHRPTQRPAAPQVGNCVIEFGGWFGVLNCDNTGRQAFFSDWAA